MTGLKVAELDRYDIAELNLCTARGLPGTENLDVPAFLDKLDEYAERVKLEICRHIYRFDFDVDREATEFSYGNSLGRFFCWYMLQVLQQDCGVCYHPDRKFNPDFCQPQDLFIHGIIDEEGAGGTCASMPVVYVAVARRLGLPVYLTSTRGHLFFRWDDPTGTTIDWDHPHLRLWLPPDRFNVEGSGEGIAYYSDAHYIQWPELWKEHDFEHGRYLRSMTAKEELAGFLVQRADCWRELGNWTECDKAIYHAIQLVPEDDRYKWLACKWEKEYRVQEERRLKSIREMDEFRRKQQANAKPAIVGHSLNCRCDRCKEIRRIAQSRPTEHHSECRCPHCRKIRELQQEPIGVPGHGPTCQCKQCVQGREVAATPAGFPGHPPTCRCGGCMHIRKQNRPHSRPGIPAHTARGLISQSQMPGMPQPHRTQPNRKGLPGY